MWRLSKICEKEKESDQGLTLYRRGRQTFNPVSQEVFIHRMSLYLKCFTYCF